jgi:hypothetical protein
MKLTTTLALASSLAVAAVAATIAGIVAMSGGAEAGRAVAPLSGKITVTGTPVSDLTARDLAVLEQMQRTGATVYTLGTIDDRVYYKIAHPEQETCYGSGPVEAGPYGRFGNLHCGGNFPSAENPILDLSVYHESAAGDVSIYRAEGIVADGITSIGFQTPSGKIVGETRVKGNAYRVSAVPAGVALTGLVALDAKGSIVRTARYGAPPTP